VPVGTTGAGQVTVTSFSVPPGSLAFWRTHLGTRGMAVSDVEPRFGEPAIRCSDLSGLTFEIVATAHDPRAPWVADGFDADTAIRGLHSVTMVVRDPSATLDLMTSLLDYHVVERAGARIRVAVNGGADAPGTIVDIAHQPAAPDGVNGIGTVHHVAMAIGSEAEQLQLRHRLLEYGCRVTEVRDRCYFKSIYFREPGGVLFEVATTEPGFAVDEAVTELGRALKLPPWEEQHRADIEDHLLPVAY
jgi:glyoxalase family protein